MRTARFLSLAFLTQLALLANQLVLLPLQIHRWGYETTAAWLGAAAIAAVLGVIDLGLRYVSYSAIAGGRATERFVTLWSVTRLHVLVGGVATIVVAMYAFGARAGDGGYLAIGLFALSAIIDQTFVIRNSYLEALGQIVRAEALYFGVIGARVLLSATAIVAFGAGPVVVGALFAVTALAGLLVQCGFKRLSEIAPLAGRLRMHGVREVYADAKWSASSPLAGWAQMQWPVLALASFAPAPIVSAFVALRVIFGLTRSVLFQVSRIFSVKYVDMIKDKGPSQAIAFLLYVCGLVALLAAWMALGVYVERFWITGRLFSLPPSSVVPLFALALGASSVLSVHQLVTTSQMRGGDIAGFGIATYSMVAVLGLSCVATALTKIYWLMLFGMVAGDVLLLVWASRRLISLGDADVLRVPVRVFSMAMAGCILAIVVGWTVFMGSAAPVQVSQRPFMELLASGVLASAVVAVAAGLYWRAVHQPLTNLMHP